MRKFRCPHCGKPHLMMVDRCPETEEGISEIYKLEGELLADRYRLKEIISEGGMGVVYDAVHEKLGRRVAIKMLHPHLRVSADTMKRFENEAKLAASVGHRCVVDVIDLGRHDGLPFFVMEHLEGEALSDILEQRGTLDRREAVDLCIELLEGLHAVHERSIIHRDLKPGNLMLVEQTGGSRILKVLDFGISRLQEAEAAGLSITKTGSIFGTPRYMSPEQAKGKKDLDARADLYAVGVILYRCITGGFPFTGDNYNALLNAIATKEPIAPSDRMDGIPEGLEAIIMKSLSRDRRERYQDAFSFIEALGPYASAPPSLTASQNTVQDYSAPDRPTIEAPPPSHEKSGTSTSWTRTGGRGWPGEFTWLLPVAIVTVLAVAVLAGLAFFLHSRLAEEQEQVARMSRIMGGKERAQKMLPAEPAGQPAPRPPVDEAISPSLPEMVLLELQGLPDGASVELDGRPLPQVPILLAPDDQEHLIVVEAPGYESWQRDVTLMEDLSLQVEMTPLTVSGKKPRKKLSEPPIDTTYPGMIGKKKNK